MTREELLWFLASMALGWLLARSGKSNRAREELDVEVHEHPVVLVHPRERTKAPLPALCTETGYPGVAFAWAEVLAGADMSRVYASHINADRCQRESLEWMREIPGLSAFGVAAEITMSFVALFAGLPETCQAPSGEGCEGRWIVDGDYARRVRQRRRTRRRRAR